MAVDPRLRTYIWQQLTQGYKVDAIEYVLVSTGYDPDTARNAVESVAAEWEVQRVPAPAITVEKKPQHTISSRKRGVIILVSVIIVLVAVAVVLLYMGFNPVIADTNTTTNASGGGGDNQSSGTGSASYVGLENLGLGNFQITSDGQVTTQVVNVESEGNAITLNSITVDNKECTGDEGTKQTQESWDISCEGVTGGTTGSNYAGIEVKANYTMAEAEYTETGSVSGRYT